MPAAAPFAAVGTAIGTGVAASTLTASAFFIGLGKIALSLAINAGITALAGKKKTGSIGPQAREVTVRGTVQPRQLIYGQLRTAGYIAYFGTAGEDNRYLYYVIVCAAHQCEDLGDVWLDSQRVNSSQFDGTTGEVLTGPFRNGSTPRLHRFVHLGTSSQAVDTDLNAKLPAVWTSDHKGSGIAYIVFRLDRDEKIYPTGAPQNFYVHVKGRRLYDPRKDSTVAGGSGSHRINDATTWEYSNNPSLAVLDYIFGGSIYYNVATPVNQLTLGDSPSRLDLPYFIAAANACDEEVLIPPASPTTEQRRFECDLQLSCDDTHRENMESILSSCVGHLSYVNGKYRVFVGVYDAPQVALVEDDILGKVSISTHPPGDENYNEVIGTFFDEARTFQPVPFPARVNSGYVTQDNGKKSRTIELPGTRNTFRAQRIGEIILRQSRNKLFVTFEALSPKAINIAEWETFTATISEFGWAQKVFRCVKWTFMPATGFISIEAREESSTPYADLLVSEYAALGSAVSPNPELEIPSPVTNFTAAGARDGLQLMWNLPESGLFGGVVELFEHTSATPFSSANLIWAGAATAKFFSKTDTTQRFYWARVRNGSQVSVTVPAVSGLPGSASSADTALSAFASPTSVSGSDDDQNGSATTNTTTVTPSGGTGGYSYAWTFASGGTDITINSATSASTTFTGTGLTVGEVLSGIARCTVTDGASTTFTVDVSVSITRPTPTLTAVVAPTSLYSERFGTGALTSASATCTGSPSGGTFAWAVVSGGTGITINSATSATTTFSVTFSGAQAYKSGQYRCVYTKDGVPVNSNTITVEFARNDL